MSWMKQAFPEILRGVAWFGAHGQSHTTYASRMLQSYAPCPAKDVQYCDTLVASAAESAKMRQEQEVYDDDQPQIEYYVPEETDYPSFDKSGLTDNAIGLIQEYVSVHGILDLTPEQVAEGMEDFMGNPSPPGSLEIAAMVLDVWMMRNPHLVAARMPMQAPHGAFSPSQPWILSSGCCCENGRILNARPREW